MKSTFPLPYPAPPGFRGLDPELPIEITYRRLPHWRQEGATYFVTFRLADSLPKHILDQVELLREELMRTEEMLRNAGSSAKVLAGERMNRFRTLRAFEEKWLDAGHGACPFRDPAKRRILADAIRFFPERKERCWVNAFVVMPNHVHAIVKPYPGEELSKIVGSWKSWTARKLGGGNRWQVESYDQIIRDDRHLQRVIRYLAKNPVDARLREDEFELWMCEEWAAMEEWRF